MKINKNNYFTTVIAFSLLVQGCSKSSDDSEIKETDSPIENKVSVDRPTVNFPELALGEITESNAVSVIKSIHDFNDFWLNRLREELEDQNLESGANIRQASFPNGESDLSEYCEGSRGAYTAKYYNGTSLQDIEGNRVYAAGDYLDLDFSFCNLGSGYYISGYHHSEVLSGYYDGNDYLAEGTKIREVYENRVLDFSTYNFTDIDSFNEFKHGALNYELVGKDQINVSGDSFAEKARSIRIQSPYKITDFDMFIERTPGKYDWLDEHDFGAEGVMNLSVSDLQAQYQLSYPENIHYTYYDDTYVSGKALLSGSNSQLELTYSETYVAYKLDQDGDGDYEVESIIMYNEL